MDDRKSDRSLALGGIVFVVLILIAGVPPGKPAQAERLRGQDREVRGRQERPAPVGRVRGRARIDRAARLAGCGVAAAPPGRGRRAPARRRRRARSGHGRRALQRRRRADEHRRHRRARPSIGASDTRFFYLLFGGLGAAGGIGLALFVGATSSVIIQTGVLPTRVGLVRRADRGGAARRGRHHRVDARRVLRLRLRRLHRVRALDAHRQRLDVPTPQRGTLGPRCQRRSALRGAGVTGGERLRSRALGVGDRVPRRRGDRGEHRVGRLRTRHGRRRRRARRRSAACPWRAGCRTTGW